MTSSGHFFFWSCVTYSLHVIQQIKVYMILNTY